MNQPNETASTGWVAPQVQLAKRNRTSAISHDNIPPITLCYSELRELRSLPDMKAAEDLGNSQNKMPGDTNERTPARTRHPK